MTACDVYQLMGETLGKRYLILPELVVGSGELFKQGAHAAVYRAAVINAKPGEPFEVCVKIFSPDATQPLSAAQKAYLKSCFIREADFYAKAKHPGVEFNSSTPASRTRRWLGGRYGTRCSSTWAAVRSMNTADS